MSGRILIEVVDEGLRPLPARRTGSLRAVGREASYTRIDAERNRQDAKFGPGPRTDSTMLPILMEEVGEVAKAFLEHDDENLRTEVVHVAAVCIQWLDWFDQRPESREGRDAGG